MRLSYIAGVKFMPPVLVGLPQQLPPHAGEKIFLCTMEKVGEL